MLIKGVYIICIAREKNMNEVMLIHTPCTASTSAPLLRRDATVITSPDLQASNSSSFCGEIMELLE